MKRFFSIIFLGLVIISGVLYLSLSQSNVSSARSQLEIWNLAVSYTLGPIERGVEFDKQPAVIQARELKNDDLRLFLDLRNVLSSVGAIYLPAGKTSTITIEEANKLAIEAGDAVFGSGRETQEGKHLSEDEQLVFNNLVDYLVAVRDGSGDELFTFEQLAQRNALIRAVSNDGMTLFAPDEEMVNRLESYVEEELEKLNNSDVDTHSHESNGRIRTIPLGKPQTATAYSHGSGTCNAEATPTWVSGGYAYGPHSYGNGTSWYHARQPNSNDCDTYVRAYTAGATYPKIEPKNNDVLCALTVYNNGLGSRVQGIFNVWYLVQRQHHSRFAGLQNLRLFGVQRYGNKTPSSNV